LIKLGYQLVGLEVNRLTRSWRL